MPSVSKKQHKFFQIVANNKKFADKVHVPQKVAKEFLEADKNKAKLTDKDKKTE